jgi:hypothetical protein
VKQSVSRIPYTPSESNRNRKIVTAFISGGSLFHPKHDDVTRRHDKKPHSTWFIYV